jgi:hypothetical protein
LIDAVPPLREMAELAAVSILSLIVGWALKSWVDAWTWRRQQMLDACLVVLEAADRFSLASSRLWKVGTLKRIPAWHQLAEQVRGEQLLEVDRAAIRLRLVAGRRGAELTVELFVAADRMYRRAIAKPPVSKDRFEEAGDQLTRAYEAPVDHARQELAVRPWWRERLSRHENLGVMSHRLMSAMREEDPFPPD